MRTALDLGKQRPHLRRERVDPPPTQLELSRIGWVIGVEHAEEGRAREPVAPVRDADGARHVPGQDRFDASAREKGANVGEDGLERGRLGGAAAERERGGHAVRVVDDERAAQRHRVLVKRLFQRVEDRLEFLPRAVATAVVTEPIAAAPALLVSGLARPQPAVPPSCRARVGPLLHDGSIRVHDAANFGAIGSERGVPPAKRAPETGVGRNAAVVLKRITTCGGG